MGELGTRRIREELPSTACGGAMTLFAAGSEEGSSTEREERKTLFHGIDVNGASESAAHTRFAVGYGTASACLRNENVWSSLGLAEAPWT